MLRSLQEQNKLAAFDPDEVQLLVRAFEDAFNVIQRSGAPLSLNGHAVRTRELLAARIIELASRGERDPKRLRDEAILYLAQYSVSDRD
ncbi:MAG TPA: hypothetical protein VH684_14555 [Xanthobacteraceae bacterium]|jgi:tartrate dehydratase beta subunit/fumarate hydratase class I family protein